MSGERNATWRGLVWAWVGSALCFVSGLAIGLVLLFVGYFAISYITHYVL